MHRIKLLDSMRGLAASVVVFHHLFTRLPQLFTGSFPHRLLQLFEAISELNVQAVLFFFFLSGFSICLSLRQELPVTPLAFNNYMYRRLKRIGPLYYAALFLTLCIGLLTHSVAGNRDYSAVNLVGNLFFLQCSKSYAGNWFAPYGDNGPLWSLSFEMFYYLLLPPFLLLLLKTFRVNTMSGRLNRIGLIAAFLISVICIGVNKLVFFPLTAFGTVFYVWYSGFFLATLYLEARVYAGLDFLLLVVLTTALLLVNALVPTASFGKLLFGSFVATAFIPLYLLRGKIKTMVAVIEKPVNFLFYRIGTGSYALYLLHFPVILLLKHLYCTSLPVAVISLAITIIGCIWVEKLFSKSQWLFLKREYLK